MYGTWYSKLRYPKEGAGRISASAGGLSACDNIDSSM